MNLYFIGLISSIISFIPSSIKSIQFTDMIKSNYKDLGLNSNLVHITLPILTWIEFIILSVIICVLLAYFSRKYIADVNIVEEINNVE